MPSTPLRFLIQIEEGGQCELNQPLAKAAIMKTQM